jgi:hypothetical protein
VTGPSTPNGGLGRLLTESPSTPAGVVFIAAMLALGLLGGHWTVVIYGLSFWHYLVYALAFVPRAVPLRVFERDAVLMKAASLLAFGWVYLGAGLDLVSLVVVGIGLLFNLSAAAALGTDRTYYGYELASLPPKRITAFPYSVIGHPMLLGNMLAFAGTLLHGGFRPEWWLLAVLHVVLNGAVLLMEIHAGPRRPKGPAPFGWPVGAGLLGVGLLAIILGGGGALALLGAALAVLGYAIVTVLSYAWPMTRP